MKYRALVTGATGYVGRHVVSALREHGWEVHITERSTSANKRAGFSLSNEIIIHTIDGTSNNVMRVLKEASPDVVFHLASLVILNHDTEDLEPLIRSNVLFGLQILEAMSMCGFKHFINTGTYWQHFDGSDYNPSNLYAATKQAFEDILRFYTSSSLIHGLTLKLFDVYGPDDPRDKLFNLLEKGYRNTELLAMTPGQQLLDLVYIDDVVKAFLQAADLLMSESANIVSGDFSVSSGKLFSLREVVNIYERIAKKKLAVAWGKIPYRPRQIMQPWRGNPVPGWRAEVDLETGICLSISNSKASKQECSSVRVE